MALRSPHLCYCLLEKAEGPQFRQTRKRTFPKKRRPENERAPLPLSPLALIFPYFSLFFIDALT